MLKQSAENTPAIYIQTQRRARRYVMQLGVYLTIAFRLNAIVGRQIDPSRFATTHVDTKAKRGLIYYLG